jgi:nitrogen-specific signal transduction histidine kinase/CheY-like chemotaxis protein
MLHRDGEVITLDIAPAQTITFNGQPAFLVGAQDVTEKKKLQAHLLFSERMASLGTLAAGVAHEINNPLAYVVANLEIVSQEIASISNLDPSKLSEISDSLKDAEDGAQRVRQIVRDLKTFSRADEETRAPTDPRKALEGALSMVWNELRHRARVVKDLRPVPEVLINEARLGQVFLNLLVNAAQAIPTGNANKHEVKLRSFTTPLGLATLEVEDTGAGIPQDKLSKIFDPFFTTKPVGVGTGLGLSICHAIVSSVGGQLEVESRLGVGTLFRVILPPAPTGASPSTPTRAPTPVPEKARVLVIDDEVSICSVIRRSLSAHDVTVRHSAVEALALLRTEAYDVVLCDLMMPVMTGIELFETLSRELPWVCPRVIFLTGGAFTPAAKEFLDKNPNLKLEKPFSMKELKSAVQAML